MQSVFNKPKTQNKDSHMQISTNKPKTATVMSLKRLIERLNKFAEVYPDALVGLDESNSSLDLYKLDNKPNPHDAVMGEYIAQILVE